MRERIEEVHTVSHEDLKKALPNVSFVVRTGETTPYSNVIVRCGVPSAYGSRVPPVGAAGVT